jgi:hypothetical protein
MLCTQFYCNAPTHQESVWIHISVVGRSHFMITHPQSKSICPPLDLGFDSHCGQANISAYPVWI